MGIVSVIVGTLAGILTIILRIRELRGSKEDKGKVVIYDATGRHISKTNTLTSSMLIPALGFTFLFMFMAGIGGFSGALALHLKGSIEPDTFLEKQIDLTDQETYDEVFEILHRAVGIILITISFPIFVAFAYRRAFVVPDKCFIKALIMGLWAGSLIGFVESLLAIAMKLGLLQTFFKFLLNFLLFTLFGLFAGLIFVTLRTIQSSTVYQRLIGIAK